MIIHSHKKHISLPILHWMHTDVVVQCSFTRVCQGVPNKMLGASYTNRDVSSFKHETCIVMDGTSMYNCPTFFLFWKCLDDMSYWTHLYRTVADNQLHFFHNFKLELYSFCEPCPLYMCSWAASFRWFHTIVLKSSTCTNVLHALCDRDARVWDIP